MGSESSLGMRKWGVQEGVLREQPGDEKKGVQEGGLRERPGDEKGGVQESRRAGSESSPGMRKGVSSPPVTDGDPGPVPGIAASGSLPVRVGEYALPSWGHWDALKSRVNQSDPSYTACL